VRSGGLGAIRKVIAEYSQGWLARPVEREGNQQAAWRADPAVAGVGGCIADIGVHAFHLAEFISGQRVSRVYADLASVVPGRALDDDCQLLLRFAGGARGALLASQIAAGDRNGLRIRVWGEAGGLDWSQETPDRLVVNWIDAPSQVLHAGSSYLSEPARRVSRLPAGHPEGFIEALANLYRDYAEAIRAGTPLDQGRVPGIDAGVRGLGLVEGAVAANRTGSWFQLDGMEQMK
jgi:predicted dehydrogenase